MTIHNRRGGGLGWNYAGLAAVLVLLAGALALVTAGDAHVELLPTWTLLRLPVGAAVFAFLVHRATRRER